MIVVKSSWVALSVRFASCARSSGVNRESSVCFVVSCEVAFGSWVVGVRRRDVAEVENVSDNGVGCEGGVVEGVEVVVLLCGKLVFVVGLAELLV